MKEIWFTIGVCINPAIGKDSMHIEFFGSEQKAKYRLQEYLTMYGTAYIGQVPKERL